MCVLLPSTADKQTDVPSVKDVFCELVIISI